MEDRYLVSKAMAEAIIARHRAEGMLCAHLEFFGYDLAKREKYSEHVGLDAIHFYVATKFSRPLAEVRAMKLEDLRFLLEEDMKGWTTPKHLRELFSLSQEF